MRPDAPPLVFSVNDPSVEAGLKRIAEAGLSTALEDLESELPLADKVHRVRETIRYLRGLLKIVAPAFPAHRKEAGALRRAARGVVDLRDSAAMVAIAREAQPFLATTLGHDLAHDLHALLERDRVEREALEDTGRRLAGLKVALLSASDRVGSWALTLDEGAALSDGIAETVGRAQGALAIAERRGQAADFEALRKQVRHHRCHTALLRSTMGGPMEAHLALADATLEALDAHRDMTLLSALLNRLQGRMSPGIQNAASEAIATRRASMEPVILGLARALLAEEPRGVARRFVTYWEVWRSGSLAPAADAPSSAIAAL